MGRGILFLAAGHTDSDHHSPYAVLALMGPPIEASLRPCHRCRGVSGIRRALLAWPHSDRISTDATGYIV